MRIIIIIIILLHGVIHLMGFLKAFELVEIKELNLPISRPMGLLWLIGTVLFVITGILYALKYNTWYMWGRRSCISIQFFSCLFLE